MCNIGRQFKIVNDEFRKYPNEIIQIPQRATEKSGCYDIRIPTDIVINPNQRKLIWSDIKAYMEDDEVLMIYIRSSLGIKGLILSNLTAVIDCDYSSETNVETGGNIGLSLWNTTDQPFFLKKGDRVCQGMFVKYLITKDDDPIKKERLGGFGHSSGTKV